jgi:hypothetical protein
VEPIHDRLAGLDVHRMKHVVTILVGQEDGTVSSETREFGGFKRRLSRADIASLGPVHQFPASSQALRQLEAGDKAAPISARHLTGLVAPAPVERRLRESPPWASTTLLQRGGDGIGYVSSLPLPRCAVAALTSHCSLASTSSPIQVALTNQTGIASSPPWHFHALRQSLSHTDLRRTRKWWQRFSSPAKNVGAPIGYVTCANGITQSSWHK